MGVLPTRRTKNSCSMTGEETMRKDGSRRRSLPNRFGWLGYWFLTYSSKAHWDFSWMLSTWATSDSPMASGEAEENVDVKANWTFSGRQTGSVYTTPHKSNCSYALRKDTYRCSVCSRSAGASTSVQPLTLPHPGTSVPTFWSESHSSAGHNMCFVPRRPTTSIQSKQNNNLLFEYLYNLPSSQHMIVCMREAQL